MNKTDMILTLLNLHWQGDGKGGEDKKDWKVHNKLFRMMLHGIKKIKRGNHKKTNKEKISKRIVKKELSGEAQIELRCHK